MVEIDFERRLERLFAETPELPDGAAFAERVERRMSVGWTTRRWLIGAAGVAGGLIGVSQLMMSNLFGQVAAASTESQRLLSGFNHAALQLEWLANTPAGGIVWPAVALAVVAMGFVLSRVIEEI